jgi:futalosine hydrolase
VIVAATGGEVAPVVRALTEAGRAGGNVTQYTFGSHDVDLLITGVGMVATAAWCGRTLAERPYDLVLNVGVCGSFDRTLPPGSVVHTVSDRIAELGAEDGEGFLSIEELGLLDRDGPYSRAELVNVSPPANSVLAALPRVTGITVNTVHGNDESIAGVVRRFHPQVETMEGAAFMYACLMCGAPFAQVRAVSNIVERRNRETWRIREAVDGLGAVVIRMLEAS